MEIDVSKMRHHEAGAILLAHFGPPKGTMTLAGAGTQRVSH